MVLFISILFAPTAGSLLFIYKRSGDLLDSLDAAVDVLDVSAIVMQVHHSEKTVEGLAEVDVVVDDEDFTRSVEALALEAAGAVVSHSLYLVGGLQRAEEAPIDLSVVFDFIFVRAS